MNQLIHYKVNFLSNSHSDWFNKLDYFIEIVSIGHLLYTEYVIQLLLYGNILLLATIGPVTLVLVIFVEMTQKQVIFKQLSRIYSSALFIPSNTSFGLALLLVPIELFSYILKVILFILNRWLVNIKSLYEASLQLLFDNINKNGEKYFVLFNLVFFSYLIYLTHTKFVETHYITVTVLVPLFFKVGISLLLWTLSLIPKCIFEKFITFFCKTMDNDKLFESFAYLIAIPFGIVTTIVLILSIYFPKFFIFYSIYPTILSVMYWVFFLKLYWETIKEFKHKKVIFLVPIMLIF